MNVILGCMNQRECGGPGVAFDIRPMSFIADHRGYIVPLRGVLCEPCAAEQRDAEEGGSE